MPSRLFVRSLLGFSLLGFSSLRVCVGQWQGPIAGALTPATPLGAVFDETRQVTVFVGLDSARQLVTWELHAGTWQRVITATTPQGIALEDRGLVWDSSARRVLLVTADDGSATTVGLWSYDGTDWRRITFAGRPTLGTSVAAAFDRARGTLVVYTGHSVWQWDGLTWQALPQPPGLTQVWDAVMAYDPLRRELVLAGGIIAPGTSNPTTWVWNGTTWTAFAAGLGRQGCGLAYDASRGQLMGVGGRIESTVIVYPTTTLQWTGSGWTIAPGLGTPSAMWTAVMAADPTDGTVVLVGQQPPPSTQLEHWSLQHPNAATFAAIGDGCQTTPRVPRLELADGQLPWLGSTAALALSDLASTAALGVLGASSTQWNGFALPLPLAPFGMPNCWLRTSVDFTTAIPATGGRATWPIPVPNAARLIGADVFAQVGVPDPTANAAGIALSRGVRLGLGTR